jgi:hypothetical protein
MATGTHFICSCRLLFCSYVPVTIIIISLVPVVYFHMFLSFRFFFAYGNVVYFFICRLHFHMWKYDRNMWEKYDSNMWKKYDRNMWKNMTGTCGKIIIMMTLLKNRRVSIFFSHMVTSSIFPYVPVAIIIIFHVFLSCFPICSCRLFFYYVLVVYFFTMFLLSIFSHVPVDTNYLPYCFISRSLYTTCATSGILTTYPTVLLVDLYTRQVPLVEY